jgi:hypothetical protein
MKQSPFTKRQGPDGKFTKVGAPFLRARAVAVTTMITRSFDADGRGR